ncbi:uncharacterized protein SCHCODRAFT_01159645 [Schizophyllum commune H4-8]|nr:uncharacterized protein SCHCODRAFT_01159645 [Schizophyllum commune H4-8]KAI5888711.1 hypothetical protein SCHCODRAFT_01159645 [Schizophyllum commune H4-8]
MCNINLTSRTSLTHNHDHLAPPAPSNRLPFHPVMSYSPTNSQSEFNRYLYATQPQELELPQRRFQAALYETQLSPEIAAHDDFGDFPASSDGLGPYPFSRAEARSHLTRSSSAYPPFVCDHAQAELSDEGFAAFTPAAQMAASPGVDLRLGNCYATHASNGYREGFGIPSLSSRGPYEFGAPAFPHTKNDACASGAASFYTQTCPTALWPSPEAGWSSSPTPSFTATDAFRRQSPEKEAEALDSARVNGPGRVARRAVGSAALTDASLRRRRRKTYRGAHLRICPHCGHTFTRTNNLKDHIRRHENKLAFKCPERGCNGAFNTMNDLKSHLQRMHRRS